MDTRQMLTDLGGIGGGKSRIADEGLLFPQYHILLWESKNSKFKPGLWIIKVCFQK